MNSAIQRNEWLSSQTWYCRREKWSDAYARKEESQSATLRNGQVAEGTYAEAKTKAERGLECVTTTEQARGRWATAVPDREAKSRAIRNTEKHS